jgi:hypothetical protein
MLFTLGATSCFGTKVPSSGSLSKTNDRKSNTYFRRLEYVLDVRSFVVDKLPENVTLLPKHVGVGT